MGERVNQPVTMEGLTNAFWHFGRGKSRGFETLRELLARAPGDILEEFLKKIGASPSS